MMKKGANTDRGELKMGSYKLLTGAEKLLALGQNGIGKLFIVNSPIGGPFFRLRRLKRRRDTYLIG